MIFMKNCISIKNGSIYQITHDYTVSADKCEIQFLDISGNHVSLEMYKGGIYYGKTEMTVNNGVASAELPSALFDGSTIHFRYAIDGTSTYGQLANFTHQELTEFTYTELSDMQTAYGAFCHIVYDTKKGYPLEPIGYTVAMN